LKKESSEPLFIQLNNIAMKQYYRSLYNNCWKPFMKALYKIVKGKDHDDPPFNHPWAIL